MFIDPLEPIVSLSKSYLDFGLGLHRQLQLGSYNELQLGYSVFHINMPNRSFLNQEDILAFRHQFFSVFMIDISNQVNVNPSLLFSNQAKQRELILGTEVSYELNNINQEVILFGSASYRVADAIILAIGTKYKQTFIGLNVDFNVSDFSQATNNYGAWEISFVHTIKHTNISRPNYQACPSFL